MVSLFELLQRQHQKKLSTGIASLDGMLPKNLGSGGIYDIHAVPGCTEQYKILAALMVSHLSQDNASSVVVIDTLHPFPVHWLRETKHFKQVMLEKIEWYTVRTISQLFTLMHSISGDLVIINNFFELIEFYKLELSSLYEEALLKHQIEVNSVIQYNLLKIQEEGGMPSLPRIPPTSDLLRESPSKKFNAHISLLSNLFSQFVRTQSLLLFLVGCLDTQYETLESLNESQRQWSQQQAPHQPATTMLQPTTATQQQYRKKRLILAPRGYVLDKFLACRLIFFKTLKEKIEVNVRVHNFREDKTGEISLKEGNNHNNDDIEDISNAHISAHLPSSPDLTESQIRYFLPNSDHTHSENLQPIEESEAAPAIVPRINNETNSSPPLIVEEEQEEEEEVEMETETGKSIPPSSPLSDLSAPSEIENSDSEVNESDILFL